MKSLLLILVTLVVFAVPAEAQRQGNDLKADVAECKGLIPATRANTAVTGAWCSLVGYGSAVAVVHSGLMDATTQYIVLQDSAVGSAVALVDSVNVATDSTLSMMAYNGTARFIRVLLRASGNAADTSWVSSVIIRGHCQSKPC